jgi:hypothetical protein
MLDVGSEKLTERERECLKHFRQAQERGVSFAEYCRSQGLEANEWHAVRHGMAWYTRDFCLGVSGVSVPKRAEPGAGIRDLFRCAWPPAVPRFLPAGQPADCGIHQVG